MHEPSTPQFFPLTLYLALVQSQQSHTNPRSTKPASPSLVSLDQGTFHQMILINDSARTTDIDFHQTTGRKSTPRDLSACICAECRFRIRFLHCLLGFKPRIAEEQIQRHHSWDVILYVSCMFPGLPKMLLTIEINTDLILISSIT